MDCLINDVLPAMSMSSVAQAFPKLDGPEEWNCAHLSLDAEVKCSESAQCSITAHLASQHGKGSSLAQVHGQAPVADGDFLLGESLQWEGGHVTSGPHARQGGGHGGVDGDETPGIDIKAGNIVGNS